MKPLSIGILAGVVAGAITALLLSYLGGAFDSPGNRLLRDIGESRLMESAEVAEHRNRQFSDLRTIETLQSLPGGFVRGEALYALCSRSNSEDLVRLAADAARLEDPLWREQALDIIFQRLTELAPATALALSRSGVFLSMRSVQATVLQTWARFDLMAAVTAVSGIDDNTQYVAAQMLYSGIGGAYTPDVVTAAQILDIAPSRSNRERYLRELYGMSPDAALEHVLSLETKSHREEQIEAIAKMATFEDMAQAEELGERIGDNALRKHYLQVVYERLAREKPAEATIKLFALRDGGRVTGTERKAFVQLVESDLDAALELLENLGDNDDLESLGKVLAARFATDDPHGALQWARSTPDQVRRSLERAVIVNIAATDAVLAMREAGRLPHEIDRGHVTQQVVAKLAELSPQMAAEQIGDLEDESIRGMAGQTLASAWLKEDAFAALDWVLTADAAVQAAVFGDRSSIRNVDLYDAQALVGSLPQEYRATWAREVAARLVAERSAEDALQFVGQFSGQPGYDMQLAHVVSRIAKQDGDLAAQWVGRIPGGYARDGALSTIVVSQVQTDPASAIELLQLIDDSDLRQDSAGDIASAWFRTDPVAARRWIDNMPRGTERDNVLFNSATSLYREPELQTALIAEIDDAEKRTQAEFMRLMMESRGNPEELLKHLDQMEMPEIFKQEIKAQILRQSVHGPFGGVP